MTDDEGRRGLFIALYERHHDQVLAYARRRVEESAARDITAETFLVAWRRLDEATERGLPWLYRTAYLTLKNWERTERRSARTVQRLAALPVEVGASDPAVAHTDREQVLDAVRSLPQADRELLLLVVWEQLDLRTAAGIVGCSAGAAAVRLHRARRRLRVVLSPPAVDRGRPDSPPVPEVTP